MPRKHHLLPVTCTRIGGSRRALVAVSKHCDCEACLEFRVAGEVKKAEKDKERRTSSKSKSISRKAKRRTKSKDDDSDAEQEPLM